MNTASVKKISFKEQQLIVREHAILDAVNRLLAAKGFDLMTLDEVALDVGIAKASVYKHFQSKEELASAAMTRMLQDALEVMEALDPAAAPLDKLKALVRWGIATHLAGQMPMLPSTRSSIRQALTAYEPYMERLIKVSEMFGQWINQAREDQVLSSSLPAEAILYTVFARCCDPVGDFLKESGAYTDEQIVEILIEICFEGFVARTTPPIAPGA
jgi:AcrR family transcriptional regulator